MIKAIVRRIVDYQVNTGNLKSEERNIYLYGYQMPNYGDAPEDIQYIEAGIDWYWDEKKQNWLSDCEDIE